MTSLQQRILHLSLIDGIGPVTIAQLLRSNAALDHIYEYSVSDFVTHAGVSVAIAQRMVQGLSDAKDLDRECALLARHHLGIITIADEIYPASLRAIHAPPAILYVHGSLDALGTAMLAMVGSRNADRYGERIVDTFIPALVSEGYTMVSGGARGIDAMVHEVTVQSQGTTIAVLGSGLLRPYPRTHTRLFDRIVSQGGLLLSPFRLEQSALPGNFPARNRIIAGLSRGCVVVQAALKSGARITAQYALEQGREVFAVPGPIESELSAGCHALIQEGARLTTCAQDIIQELETGSHRVHIYEQQEPIVREQQSKVRLAQKIEAKAEIEPESHPIIQWCQAPISTDELLIKTGLTMHELHHELFELQLEGRIFQNGAGLWEI